jgi:hypothetical protein
MAIFDSYERGGLRATAHVVSQTMPPKARASATVKNTTLVGLNQSQSATKLIRTTTAITAITPGCLQGLRCGFMKGKEYN